MSIFDNFPNFDFCARASREERSARPDIVDVEYQEVKSSHESPGFDKTAREKQLIDAAFSQTKDLMEKAPLSGMVHTVIWIEGAKWADDHRLSSYPSRTSWIAAGKEALHKHLQDMNPEALQDHVFMAILFVSFTLGAQWAESHPANG